MSDPNPRAEDPFYADGTSKILWDLVGNETPLVMCILAPEPAIGIYRTPAGCVARPNDEFQPLCPQHLSTDGVHWVGDAGLVVDLTASEVLARDLGVEVPLHLGYTAAQLQEYLAKVRPYEGED